MECSITDWSAPGKVYAAQLSEDLSSFNTENQIKLHVIKDDMLKNHGYYRIGREGYDTCIISSENGVYQFIPPKDHGSEWEIEQLLDTPASDATLIDLDEDGVEELVVLSPFHGDQMDIYKRVKGVYSKIFSHDKKTEFLPALYKGNISGKPVVFIGHRKGERDLFALNYDKVTGQYQVEVIDHNCGSANAYYFNKDGIDTLITTNREINEVTMYRMS
ncbi:MAG: hypothetical protein ACK5ML_13450 [Lachnospiraceae bacterium]